MNKHKKYLPYGKHHIDDFDIEEVVRVLKSDFLTTGSKTIEFESEFAKHTESKFAISCSSGTAALHLALLSLDLPKNSNIIVPSISFLATANVVELIGGKIMAEWHFSQKEKVGFTQINFNHASNCKICPIKSRILI